MLSNRPGEIFEPVTAMRIGSNALRGESSSRAASSRSAVSISAAPKGSTPSSSSRAATTTGTAPSPSATGDSSSRKRKPAKSGNCPKRSIFSCTSGSGSTNELRVPVVAFVAQVLHELVCVLLGRQRT